MVTSYHDWKCIMPDQVRQGLGIAIILLILWDTILTSYLLLVFRALRKRVYKLENWEITNDYGANSD